MRAVYCIKLYKTEYSIQKDFIVINFSNTLLFRIIFKLVFKLHSIFYLISTNYPPLVLFVTN